PDRLARRSRRDSPARGRGRAGPAATAAASGMRLFLAIALPEPLRRAAALAAERLDLGGSAWRVARGRGRHVTLRCLGPVDATRRAAAADAWRRSAAGTGEIPLRLASGGAFPRTGPPRVIWLGIDDLTAGGELGKLAARLESA